MPSLAADLKDKVKVEIDSVGLHPGMEPGMYVCGLGHLHIKGTVQNLTRSPSERSRWRERLSALMAASGNGHVFDEAGYPCSGREGRESRGVPNRYGPLIEKVKRHELAVLEAPAGK